MKKNLQLFVLFLLAFSLSQFESKAQLTLIHYWNFNCTAPLGGAGGTHLGTQIADYSLLPSGDATIAYKPVASGVKVAADSGYLDNITGDTLNQRDAYGNTCSPNNAAMRTRNPSDSMEFIWNIPTTGYKNIVLTWEVQSSSTTSGMLTSLYSYSIDGGTTFITSGLSRTVDSTIVWTVDNPLSVASAPLTWYKKSLDLTGIAGVDNNGTLQFRILFGPQNTSTKGNNRWDNVTVEGDVDTSTGIAQVSGTSNIIYPNPVTDNLNITTTSAGSKTVTIYNCLGQAIITEQFTNKSLSVSTSNLSSGIYCVSIFDNNTEKSYTQKFIKN